MTVFREPKSKKHPRVAARALKVVGGAALGAIAGLGVSSLLEKRSLPDSEVLKFYQQDPVREFPNDAWKRDSDFLRHSEFDRIHYRDAQGRLREFRFTTHGIRYPTELNSILPPEGKERLSSIIDAYVKRNMGNANLFIEMTKQMQRDPVFARLSNDRERVTYFVWHHLHFSTWNLALTPSERASLYQSMHFISPSVFRALEREVRTERLQFALSGAAVGAAAAFALSRRGKGKTSSSRAGFLRVAKPSRIKGMRPFPGTSQMARRPRFPSLRGRRPR